MTNDFDVIVVGLGAVGAMTLLHLAQNGIACLGVDRTVVGAPHGASNGGDTRIFRSGWSEGEQESLRYARQIWSNLSSPRGEFILSTCGALTIGSRRDPRFMAALAAAERHEQFDVLEALDANSHWPMLALSDEHVVLHDRGGGLLRAAEGVVATVSRARTSGARILENTTVFGLTRTRDSVRIETNRGALRAACLVVAAGSVPSFLRPDSTAALEGVESRRVTLFWRPTGEHQAGLEALPPGLVLLGGGRSMSFFPPINQWGVKINYIPASRPAVASDVSHPGVTPDDLSPGLAASDAFVKGLEAGVTRVETFVEHYAQQSRGVVAGLYDGRVLVTTGFSGEGYRLAPSSGRDLAAQALAVLTA